MSDRVENMPTPIMIKPQRHKYILYSIGLATVICIGIVLSSSLIYKDVSLAYGGIIGSWIGVPLLWLYGEITKFKRFTIIVADNYVQVPAEIGLGRLSAETLDKARTFAYMPKKNLNNWLAYSFWLTNGQRYSVSKHLYAVSDIKIILEKLGCHSS